MSDPLLPEITGHLLAAMDGDIAPSNLRALAARLIDQVRADEAERQRARDYVTLWQRLMLEDRKYRAALARVVEPARLLGDPGYHSQRCLHCDHIRATHTLTAHGCIGHALPGRPGADCPCAEFIHDGVATT